jgi:hypothetical protein
MLTVTDAAGRYILGVLDRRGIPKNVAARLNVVAGDLDVKMDQARPGDVQLSHKGRIIIFLDPATAQSLAGRTIDVQQGPFGPRLLLCAT